MSADEVDGGIWAESGAAQGSSGSARDDHPHAVKVTGLDGQQPPRWLLVQRLVIRQHGRPDLGKRPLAPLECRTCRRYGESAEDPDQQVRHRNPSSDLIYAMSAG